MNYELAKQLKEAGFPIREWDHSPYTAHLDDLELPSLEELIEACGLPIRLSANAAGYWYARNADHSEAVTAEGTTPTEAVARLWLALNLKQQ